MTAHPRRPGAGFDRLLGAAGSHSRREQPADEGIAGAGLIVGVDEVGLIDTPERGLRC